MSVEFTADSLIRLLMDADGLTESEAMIQIRRRIESGELILTDRYMLRYADAE